LICGAGSPNDSIVKAVVKSMHEDHRVASTGPFGNSGKRRAEALPIEMLCRQRHKITMRISLSRYRPLDYADRPHAHVLFRVGETWHQSASSADCSAALKFDLL
jgi:hypothetical protein